MLLRAPVIITPRLLPGLKIGDYFLSIRRQNIENDGRVRYRCYLDSPIKLCGLKYEGILRCDQTCPLQEVLWGALKYLVARGAPNYSVGEGVSVTLVEWCREHYSELIELECIVFATPGLIKE